MASKGQRIEYTIGFTADTSGAKKAISELESSFRKIDELASANHFTNINFNQAADSAKELQTQLSKAVNVDTGKLDLNKFMTELDKSGTSLSDLSANLLKAGSVGQQSFNALINSIAQSEVKLKSTQNVFTKFATTLKNSVGWEISSSVIHGVESALSNAISYVKNLNSSLNDIRIVTGQSAEQMASFAQSANVAAKKLSTTTKAYADASLIYYQQGDDDETVAKKAEITIKAANTAFEASAEEMSEMLTAVWNSYQAGEDELEKYVDIMAALGATTATSTEEIATAMQKVAATANTVGVSMEQMSSIIATVASVTREAPESIGTSFKTILARIGDLKLGETLDDGTTLGTVSSQLAQIGVNVLDANGNLQDMGDIIENLMTKWNSLTDAQKTATAQAVAGKRQYTQFMALMENQDMYQSNLKVAETSDGTLQKQADTYAESWSAAASRTQAELEELYSKVLSDSALIGFQNALTGIIGVVNDITDSFGGLLGVLGNISAIVIKMNAQQISQGIASQITKAVTYFSQFKQGTAVATIGNFIGTTVKRQSKSAAEIREEQATSKVQAEIAKIQSGVSPDSSASYAASAAQEQLKYKQQLLGVQNQLTDAEKQEALAAMSNLNAQQSKISSLKAQIEEVGQKLNEKVTLKSAGIYTNMDHSKSAADNRAQLTTNLNEGISKVLSGDSTYAYGRVTSASSTNIFKNQVLGATDIASISEAGRAIGYQRSASALSQKRLSSLNKMVGGTGLLSQADADVLNSQLNGTGYTFSEGDRLDEIIKKLQEIQDQSVEAEQALSEVIDAGTTGPGDSSDQLHDILDESVVAGVSQGTLSIDTSQAESKVESLRAKVKEALTPGTSASQALANSLRTAMSAVSSFSAGLSVGSNLVETLGDKSASSADKISALGGALSTVATGFATGGVWGGVAAFVGSAITAVIASIEKAKKEFQEAEQEIADKRTENINDYTDDESNKANLIKEYNQLYETYLKTGEGQDELTESAKKLADAYGLVGASVALAAGDFESFNKQVVQSIQSGSGDNFVSTQIKLLKKSFTDGVDTGDSLYHLEDSGKRASTYASSMQSTSDLNKIAVRDIFTKAFLSPTEITDNYANLLKSAKQSSTIQIDDLGYKAIYEQILQAVEGDTAKAQQAFEVWLENAFQSADQTSIKGMATDIIGGTANGNYNGEFSSTVLTGTDLALVNDQLGLYDMASTASLEELGITTTDVSDVLTDSGAAKWNQLKTGEEIFDYYEQVQNKIQTLENEKAQINQLLTNDNLAPETEAMLDTRLKWLTETIEVLEPDNNLTEAQKTALDQIETLTQQENQKKLLSAQIANILGQSEENTDLFGTNSFQTLYQAIYDSYVQNAADYDELSKYLEFDDTGAVKMNNNGLPVVIAGQEEAFENAVMGLTSTFLDTYSSFDDYASIMTAIYSRFDSSNRGEILQYLQNEGIKQIDQINDAYLDAIEYVLEQNPNADLASNELLKAAKAAAEKQSDTNALDTAITSLETLAKTDWTDVSTLADAKSLFSKYKNLSETLGEGVMLSWEEFLALGTDGMATYLEYMEQTNRGKIKEIANETKTAQEKLLESINDEIEKNHSWAVNGTIYDTKGNPLTDVNAGDYWYSLLTDFKNKYVEKDGQYQYTDDAGSIITYSDEISAFKAFLTANGIDPGNWFSEGFLTDVKQYADLKDQADNAQSNIDNADATIAAADALNPSESDTKKITQLSEAISSLNSELETFINTGKLSAEAMALFQENGIDPSSIKNAKDYILQMRQLYALQKQAVEHQKEEFKNITGVDYDPNKVWSETDKNDPNSGYSAWAAITEQIAVLDDTYSQIQEAVNTTAAIGQSKISSRISAAEKESEKKTEKADILAEAITTGYLTEEQKAKLTSVELTTAATNDQSRLSVINRLYAQSANETVAAYMEQQQAQYQAANKLLSVSSTTKFDSSKELLDVLEQKGFTAEELGEVSTAWDNIISEKGSNYFADKTNQEIIDEIEAELRDMGLETEQAMKTAAAVAKDAMISAAAATSQSWIDSAESAADAWLEAFNTINSAKETLLSGESLLESIAGDPSKLLQYWKNSSGYESFSDFIQAIFNDEITSDDLITTDYDTLVNSTYAKYGVKQSNGSYTLITGDVVGDRKALGYSQDWNTYSTEDQNKVIGLLESYYKNILTDFDTTGLTEEEIEALAKAAASGDSTALKQIQSLTGDLSQAIKASTQAQYVYNSKTLAETSASAEVNKAERTTKYGERDLTEEQLTTLQSAISEAQTAKNNGESWESLDSTTQTLLRQYGINFDNVDTAAIACADALQLLAEAAQKATIEAANREGFYENGEGKYEQALTESEWKANYSRLHENAENAEVENAWKSAQKTTSSDGNIIGFTGVVSQTLTDTITSATKAATDAAGAAADQFMANIDSMANAVGMTRNEFQTYAQVIYEAGGAVEDFNSLTKIQQMHFYEAARATQSAEEGFSSLTSTTTSTWNILRKKTKAATGEYVSALTTMKSNMAKIFNVDMNKITNQFVEDHLEQMYKMANGTKEEAMEAQDAIEDDLVAALMEADGTSTVKIEVDGVEESINALDIFQNQFDSLDGEEIGTHLNVDDSAAMATLAELVSSAGLSAEQITDYFNAIGWTPEIEYQPVNFDTASTVSQDVYVQSPSGGYSVVEKAEMRNDQQYYIPVLKGATKTSTPGGGIKSSSGGGGGGGEPEKIDKKEPEDEIERYHHVNKVLDRLSDQLDEVDKKKSRVYGKSYLNYINQEIALTKKQCEAYQEYIDEAKEYLSLDAERVASLGATFDEYGNIENYDEVMMNIINKYNEFVDRYNNMTAAEQETAKDEKEDWDEWYDEKTKWIENYEDTISTIYEQQNNLLEAQNQISESTLEGIQYKVEVHMDISDAEKEFLEYLDDLYDDVLEKQGEAMDNLVKETVLAVDNLSALGASKAELDEAYEEGTLNSADYVEGLKNLNDQILEQLKDIDDLKEKIEELYGDTLETASKDLDEQTSKLENMSKAMESYISILGLIGEGSNLKSLTKFYDAQYEYNLQSLAAQQKYLDTLKAEQQYYLDRIESGQELSETERQQYEDLEAEIEEVNESILSDTQSTLEQIQDAFKNEIEIIFDDLEERVAGVGNSLEDLSDAYSYYQEEQERYVTTAKELYEVNKLNREIENTMNTTNSKVNKNLLAALQDRINKQSEMNELTEYDIEMNQLQYELLLKKIALEEAQNAKSTVRLTRDSGGNYIYQYTADQNELATKQQEYEDVLEEINEKAISRTQDLESQLLEIYSNTVSKMKEIAEDQTLTEEEKYDKIQTLMSQFKDQTNYIQEQYQIASDNLITSNLAISQHYGEELVEHSQDAQNGMNQTIAAIIADTENLQAAFENACTSTIPSAMDTMQDRINQVKDTVGVDFDSMANSLDTYNKVTKDAVAQNDAIVGTLTNEVLPAIHSTTSAWDSYANALKSVTDTYENMYQAIVKTIEAQSKLSNASSPTAVKVNAGSGTWTASTVNATSGGSGGSGSGGSGGSSGTYNGTNGVLNITYTTYVGTTSSPASLVKSTWPTSIAVGTSVAWAAKQTGYTIQRIFSNNTTLVSVTSTQITAKNAGSVRIIIIYEKADTSHSLNQLSGRLTTYATGGLADFTGPAWLDGTSSKPELVLNPEDTENLLTAVQGMRGLDPSTLSMLNRYVSSASLAMQFGLSGLSAGSILSGSDTLQQEVHITAEFPNATDSAEIQSAFDNIINRATQYITTKR